MPLHDWTRVPASVYHHFHQMWSTTLCTALNAGFMPKGYAALVEQRAGTREADVLALRAPGFPKAGGGVATLERPKTRVVRQAKDIDAYARKANRIAIKRGLGRTVAVIEIVSPGNKSSRLALDEFVDKTVGYLDGGVHVLVVDPFPPTKRDPRGLHPAIWESFEDDDFVLPTGEDRTLASYVARPEPAAYVETVGVGMALASMPVFLTTEYHFPAPLEATYQETWDTLPEMVRTAVETGVLPELGPDDDD
jgi:hypothetical protein